MDILKKLSFLIVFGGASLAGGIMGGLFRIDMSFVHVLISLVVILVITFFHCYGTTFESIKRRWSKSSWILVFLVFLFAVSVFLERSWTYDLNKIGLFDVLLYAFIPILFYGVFRFIQFLFNKMQGRVFHRAILTILGVPFLLSICGIFIFLLGLFFGNDTLLWIFGMLLYITVPVAVVTLPFVVISLHKLRQLK